MATDTDVINAVFGLGTSDIPLLPTALEQWYAVNVEPDVLAQLAGAPSALRAQFQNEVWQAFRQEQFGKTANTLNAERTQLRTRYAGLARSKAVSASTTAPPERLPQSADEQSANQIYDAVYNAYRSTNEPAARQAASAGKAAFLQARARGADLATAVQSAQTVALQTWRASTGQPGGVTPPPQSPPAGGGNGGLPGLPPLDMGGGGGLPTLPPLDMGGGGLPTLPPLDIGGGSMVPGSMTGRAKFDPGTMFATTLDVPEWVAMIPWSQLLSWMLDSGDPASEGFLSQLLNRLLGRNPTEVNHANCALMSEMFVQEYPEAARAVAYFQCGVTHPIGLESKQAQAVWHALHLVTAGYVVQATHGGCSCGPRSGRDVGIMGRGMTRA
jgi:hypothetical protein